ncbi:hypothetical protein C943_03885 [Mariniradius saccharolyticus AK6]|uniref:Uncharacterized protein n=1 Tax=Mariniradius saccharolyticus AK6 TaxID=1239962 RepID=M7XGV6_9BACT|nr:hypothetical protein C943_03885 [Mariniradius saccharolyticus AK6]
MWKECNVFMVRRLNLMQLTRTGHANKRTKLSAIFGKEEFLEGN